MSPLTVGVVVCLFALDVKQPLLCIVKGRVCHLATGCSGFKLSSINCGGNCGTSLCFCTMCFLNSFFLYSVWRPCCKTEV